MGSFIDSVAYLDVIDRLEGVISGFLNANWKGAVQQQGVTGIPAEIGRTITGGNAWRIHVPRDGDWSGQEIERFLAHYGVKLWGRGFDGDTIFFTVKRRQANWAEYLLRRRGIPIVGQQYNPRNADYGEAHAPGDQPPAWADRARPTSVLDEFLDLF